MHTPPVCLWAAFHSPLCSFSGAPPAPPDCRLPLPSPAAGCPYEPDRWEEDKTRSWRVKERLILRKLTQLNERFLTSSCSCGVWEEETLRRDRCLWNSFSIWMLCRSICSWYTCHQRQQINPNADNELLWPNKNKTGVFYMPWWSLFL